MEKLRTKIDLETWNRGEHYRFFSEFEEPFFGVTAEVDITIAKSHSKIQGFSFFNYYLHQVSKAINEITNLKYRIENKEVFLYDTIDISSTFLREDKTFSFSNIKYDDSFEKFSKSIETEKNRIQSTTGIGLDDKTLKNNIIHVSTLPWITFQSLSHARNFKVEDSSPKITFAKFYEKDGRYKLPVSIHAHHGLVDGYHVGIFFTRVQELLDIKHNKS